MDILTEDQNKEFREWARDNYTKGDKVLDTWHPIVIDECKIINNENNE